MGQVQQVGAHMGQGQQVGAHKGQGQQVSTPEVGAHKDQGQQVSAPDSLKLGHLNMVEEETGIHMKNFLQHHMEVVVVVVEGQGMVAEG